jgi:hypothetical protein
MTTLAFNWNLTRQFCGKKVAETGKKHPVFATVMTTILSQDCKSFLFLSLYSSRQNKLERLR